MKEAKNIGRDGIETHNKERKELDQSITKEILLMVDENKKSTVVYSNDWHKGVVGIVEALRLIEKHYKPTIVLSENDDELTGSNRSVKELLTYMNIIKM